MSLREVPSSRPLLARKGAAKPANLKTAKADPDPSPPRSIEDIGEIAPGSATPDLLEGLTTGAAGERGTDSAPAASLLPFNLLRQRYRPEVSPDLIDDEPDLTTGGQDPANPPDGKAAGAAALPADLVAVQPTLAAKRDVEPESPARPRLEPRIGAPDSAGPTPPAPKPDPDWRVGATPAVAVPAPDAARPTRGGWLMPLAAMVVAFVILGAGWRMANPDVDLGHLWAPIAAAIDPILSKTETLTATATATSAPTAAEPAAVVPSAPVPPAPAAPVATGPAPKSSAEVPQAQNAAVATPEVPPSDAPATVSVAVPPQPLQTELPPPATTAPMAGAPSDGVSGSSAPAAPDQSVSAPSVPVAETAKESPSEPVEVTAIVKPTVDVVRLEANGEAVIAGRAAPNSELIVLDNGKPIGSVKADAFGEWVFVPEAALPAGEHEFGLVLKTVQETVSLPAPSKPLLPPAPDIAPKTIAPAARPADGTLEPQNGKMPDASAKDEQDGAAVTPAPLPTRKPAPGEARSESPAEAQVADQSTADQSTVDQASAAHTASGKPADFVVQLASVKTRSGAEQEWRKLQQRFPEILADMVPALDEVKLADFGTVVRVRTGAFDSQQDAANLCARLTAQRQDCLVVRVSTGN